MISRRDTLYFTSYLFIMTGVGLWIMIAATVVNAKSKADTVQPKATSTKVNPATIPGIKIVSQAPAPTQAVTPTPAPKTKQTKATQAISTNTKPPSGLPTRLIIPKIGVNAYMEYAGLDKNGVMEVPRNFANVAWYQGGYKIGGNGSAVITGHYDTTTGAPAVFYSIAKLVVGNEITVVDTNGYNHKFKVTRKQVYPYDQLPLSQIFASGGTPGLNLITCSGKWDKTAKNYSERTVIYATKI